MEVTSSPEMSVDVLRTTRCCTPEQSIRKLPGCKECPARKADDFTAICEPIVYKIWEPRRLTTLSASTACFRDSFTFYNLYFPRCLSFSSALASVKLILSNSLDGLLPLFIPFLSAWHCVLDGPALCIFMTKPLCSSIVNSHVFQFISCCSYRTRLTLVN
jgi:hypothetical protein